MLAILQTKFANNSIMHPHLHKICTQNFLSTHLTSQSKCSSLPLQRTPRASRRPARPALPRTPKPSCPATVCGGKERPAGKLSATGKATGERGGQPHTQKRTEEVGRPSPWHQPPPPPRCPPRRRIWCQRWHLCRSRGWVGFFCSVMCNFFWIGEHCLLSWS